MIAIDALLRIFAHLLKDVIDLSKELLWLLASFDLVLECPKLILQFLQRYWLMVDY
jgi:hypothetical protein